MLAFVYTRFYQAAFPLSASTKRRTPAPHKAAHARLNQICDVQRLVFWLGKESSRALCGRERMGFPT